MTNNDLPGMMLNPPFPDSSLSRLMTDPTLGARRHVALAGSTLHEAGAAAADFFFIHQGEVRLYQLAPDGSRRLLDILGPGDWFGVEALGQIAHYGSQARAITDTICHIAPAARLLAALPQRPQASREMIQQLAGRLNTATEEGSRMAFDDCRQRLLKTLVRYSSSAAATIVPDGVILRITHEQLAQAVGAARETVTLTLTSLRQAKLLRTGRNRVSFNPLALSQILNAEF